MIRKDTPVEVQAQPVRVSVWSVAGVWVARRAMSGGWAIVRNPAALVALTVLVVAWILPGAAAGALVVLVLFVGAFWRVQFPATFDRIVVCSWRSWTRGAAVYRWRWSRSLRRCAVIDRGEPIPGLLAVKSNRFVDVVRVRMAPGQTVDRFAVKSEALAQTFGVLEARVASVASDPQLLDVTFLVNDPLADPVAPAPPGDEPLPVDGLPVARCESGRRWRLQIVGRHVLVAGITGGGKSSVLWSIIWELCPAIEAGLVRLWVIDPKGGMELTAGRKLFDRFAYGGETVTQARAGRTFARVLDDAVRIMKRRQTAMREAGIRKHTPSAAEPLYLILVDELASLTGYGSSVQVARRIKAALGLLLSQGRAPGVCVLGAVQDPRKDVVPMRDLFTTRIALRLQTETQVGMVLGDDAHERGARCELIDPNLPGVAYVGREGTADVERIRFEYISDPMIENMVRAAKVVGADDEPDPVDDDPVTYGDEEPRRASAVAVVPKFST